jgi:hypothetical protein
VAWQVGTKNTQERPSPHGGRSAAALIRETPTLPAPHSNPEYDFRDTTSHRDENTRQEDSGIQKFCEQLKSSRREYFSSARSTNHPNTRNEIDSSQSWHQQRKPRLARQPGNSFPHDDVRAHRRPAFAIHPWVN